MEFIFKGYKVDGGMMQVYMAIATSPWALKPLIGLLSDSLPIAGYRKMPYILGTSITGLIGALLLGLPHLTSLQLSLGMVMASLFLAFLMVATADLLVEAKQSAEIRHSAELGPDFFLFTWLGIVIGMILVTLLVGPLIQYVSPHACYVFALPFMVIAVWPTLMNFMGEERISDGESTASRLASNFRRHPEMCCLCIGMAVILLGISSVTFIATEDDVSYLQGLVSVVAALLLIVGLAVFIRSEMAHPVIFWFILAACPKVDGAMFYFYTDGVEAFPGGPHFSPWMYTTGIGLAGFLGVLFGYLSGSMLFASWRYPSILLLTVPCRALTRAALLPVLWRWTASRYNFVGVPEGHADLYWVLPIEFLSSMLFSWSWIPKQVMNAHMTPKGNEATMLALTAGTFNLGSIIASYVGCWLLGKFNVCPKGDANDPEDFVNLWKAYLISVLAPVLVLIALPFFIPNKLQTEVLITEHTESATYGSVCNRLMARPAEDEAAQPGI